MFITNNPLRPSLMFVRKAGTYPSGGPKSTFPLGLGSGPYKKHWTRLERLARDKQYSLLQTLVNYGRKKF